MRTTGSVPEGRTKALGGDDESEEDSENRMGGGMGGTGHSQEGADRARGTMEISARTKSIGCGVVVACRGEATFSNPSQTALPMILSCPPPSPSPKGPLNPVCPPPPRTSGWSPPSTN